MDAWRASGLFESVEAARVTSILLDTPGGRLEQPAADVTAGVFDLLGVKPIRGRSFAAVDGGPGSAEVIISEAIWESFFGRDPDLLGRTLVTGEGRSTIVGIMPASFRFPTPATVAWKAFLPRSREPGEFTIFGRTTIGVPLTDVEVHTTRLAQEFARLPRNYVGAPTTAAGILAGGRIHHRALWALLAGAVLVLAVLSANVGGLRCHCVGTAARVRSMALGVSRRLSAK